MLRPTDEQLQLLQGFERTAFEIAAAVNGRPALKRAAHAFLRTVGAGWVHVCTQNILRAYGVEHIADLAPDRGVIVVSNHRSFFDMYVISCVMLKRTQWIKGMYFPVRADFFYEKPTGVAVNAIMSAMAMYPPVLRRPEGRLFNSYTVDMIAEACEQPGTLVGFHPEGTRNKTDDPYTLLPASPGVGQIVHRARPIVIPAFILGLSNDLPRQVRGNFNRTGEPITLVFGKPLDMSEHYDRPAKLRTYKNIADHLRDEVAKLGALERSIRDREGLPSKAPPLPVVKSAEPSSVERVEPREQSESAQQS